MPTKNRGSSDGMFAKKKEADEHDNWGQASLNEIKMIKHFAANSTATPAQQLHPP
jgi:hypothetical protein